MSTTLQALIAELRALRATYGDDTARAALATRTVNLPPDKRARLDALIFLGDAQTGDVQIKGVAGRDNNTLGAASVDGQGRVTGANVGVNAGTIQLFFGAEPPGDAKALLDSYLRSLIAEHGYLRLGKLLERERSGRDQAIMPEIALLKVYTTLTTNEWLQAGSLHIPATLDRAQLRGQMAATDPSQVLPSNVRFPTELSVGERPILESPSSASSTHFDWQRAWSYIEQNRQDGELRGRWYRPEQSLDAIQANARLVLLGSPGSGKSTVLRYLAVWIAEALLHGRDPKKPLPIPFFCPLGPVAQRLSHDPEGDLEVLIDALLRPVLGPAGLRAGLREAVLLAWRKGGALICLDGLDEVSGTLEETTQVPRSRRERLADAIRQLDRQLDRSRLVVTCRTRPYEQNAAWQLREDWAVRRLQPFAFGQVRHFVRAWYTETCGVSQALFTPQEAVARAQRLVAILEQREVLRELTTSPLLLTMLVLLDYNKKEMPEKRVDVYDELVKLLLDRWEGVRSSDVDRRQQSVGERLALVHLSAEDFRPVLHQLAFSAHQQAVDGRGVLTGALLRDTLDAFFRAQLNPANPKEVPRAEVVWRSDGFIHILREETGMVLEEADETYVLPHLTFEEYLAACHLADQEDVDLIYAQWMAGGERWREVVVLLMGRLTRQTKRVLAFSWLHLLIAPRSGLADKPPGQRQRDALLAASCYAELGRRGAFVGSAHDVLGFEDQLRTALVALLERPAPAMLLPQCLEAGHALAALVDPRYPVEDRTWQMELGQLNRAFGRPAGYFCFVPGGRYQIGGWPEEKDDAGAGVIDRLKRAVQRVTTGGVRITLQPFWIARLPITVAQMAPFVAETGDKPGYWDREGYHDPNQAVVGISWGRATTYCTWLTGRLAGSLPAGYVLRLPTEAEWEVAAAWDGTAERRPYPWGREEPTPERAIYTAAQLGAPAPVGCCASGAAACGALDMAGNVWEACASDYRAYPAGAHEPQKDLTSGRAPWRGGSYYEDSTNVRCGARDRDPLGLGGDDYGFRLVLAPQLAHLS